LKNKKEPQLITATLKIWRSIDSKKPPKPVDRNLSIFLISGQTEIEKIASVEISMPSPFFHKETTNGNTHSKSSRPKNY
jgi:hypothetical protein